MENLENKDVKYFSPSRLTYLLNSNQIKKPQGVPWQSSRQDFVFSVPRAWGSIPGQGTKTLQASHCSHKKEKPQ